MAISAVNICRNNNQRLNFAMLSLQKLIIIRYKLFITFKYLKWYLQEIVIEITVDKFSKLNVKFSYKAFTPNETATFKQ